MNWHLVRLFLLLFVHCSLHQILLEMFHLGGDSTGADQTPPNLTRLQMKRAQIKGSIEKLNSGTPSSKAAREASCSLAEVRSSWDLRMTCAASLLNFSVKETTNTRPLPSIHEYSTTFSKNHIDLSVISKSPSTLSKYNIQIISIPF